MRNTFSTLPVIAFNIDRPQEDDAAAVQPSDEECPGTPTPSVQKAKPVQEAGKKRARGKKADGSPETSVKKATDMKAKPVKQKAAKKKVVAAAASKGNTEKANAGGAKSAPAAKGSVKATASGETAGKPKVGPKAGKSGKLVPKDGAKKSSPKRSVNDVKNLRNSNASVHAP